MLQTSLFMGCTGTYLHHRRCCYGAATAALAHQTEVLNGGVCVPHCCCCSFCWCCRPGSGGCSLLC